MYNNFQNATNDVDHYRALAKECRRNGDFEGWEKTLQEGLQRHPENPEFLIGLSRCMTETSRPGEALRYIEQAFELQPDVPDVATSYARLLQEAGDLERAELIYLWAYNDDLPYHAKNKEVLQALSTLYIDMGNIEAATLCIGRAVKISPESPSYAKAYESLRKKHGHEYSGEKWKSYLDESQQLLDHYAHELPGFEPDAYHDEGATCIRHPAWQPR